MGESGGRASVGSAFESGDETLEPFGAQRLKKITKGMEVRLKREMHVHFGVGIAARESGDGKGVTAFE
jgi:hypothetical protein